MKLFQIYHTGQRMNNYKLAIIVLLLIILLTVSGFGRERFGESIYIDASGAEPPRESPNIFTSGATMRVIGQSFSATNQ